VRLLRRALSLWFGAASPLSRFDVEGPFLRHDVVTGGYLSWCDAGLSVFFFLRGARNGSCVGAWHRGVCFCCLARGVVPLWREVFFCCMVGKCLCDAVFGVRLSRLWLKLFQHLFGLCSKEASFLGVCRVGGSLLFPPEQRANSIRPPECYAPVKWVCCLYVCRRPFEIKTTIKMDWGRRRSMVVVAAHVTEMSTGSAPLPTPSLNGPKRGHRALMAHRSLLNFCDFAVSVGCFGCAHDI
jgi:hypothetical protein